MSDSNRIDEILEELSIYWKMHPDLRLAQIISNAFSNAFSIRSMRTGDIFFMEDDKILEYLKGRSITEDK